MKILATLFLLITYYLLLITSVNAISICESVYGGGLSEFCVQTQVMPTPTPKGFPVFPAPQVTKTPATGPEALPLIGIFSSGVIGYFLRRKTKK